jgi:hypothetical protein
LPAVTLNILYAHTVTPLPTGLSLNLISLHTLQIPAQ